MKAAGYHKVIRCGLVLVIIFISMNGFSQAVPPPIPPPPPPGLPINGGLGLLMLAGIFYGTKKYKDSSS